MVWVRDATPRAASGCDVAPVDLDASSTRRASSGKGFRPRLRWPCELCGRMMYFSAMPPQSPGCTLVTIHAIAAAAQGCGGKEPGEEGVPGAAAL